MRDLPANWQRSPLANLVHADKPIVYGIVQAGPEHAGGIPYIKSTNVGGRIDPQGLSLTSPAIAQKYRRSVVRPGDIVFSLRGNIGELSIVPDSLPEANLTQGTARISIDGRAFNEFIAAALRSPDLQKRIDTVSKGSTFREISLEELRRLEIPLPPLPEQRKIAAILRTWDEAIEKFSALRKAKAWLRLWLRTEVVSGKKRLPGFSDTWPTVRLSDVLTEHGESSTGEEEVYSVSVHKGLINQIEHLGRSFAASNTDHYNRVLPGDIVYTKSPTGEFPLGIIKQSRVHHPVIVSPLYGVFTPVTRALGIMLDAHFEAPVAVRNYLNPLVQKGAKNTIAIANARFLEGRLRLPLDPKEQAAIADILETSRRELNVVDREIAALTRQKRGLMQKLLTGEWPVKPDLEPDYD